MPHAKAQRHQRSWHIQIAHFKLFHKKEVVADNAKGEPEMTCHQLGIYLLLSWKKTNGKFAFNSTNTVYYI